MTTPLPAVRVAWRPEQFNRVTNPGFETNTSGWSVLAGINAAGTSVTRVTTDAHSGSASATVVCTATDGSGVNFDLGSDRYFAEASYGAMYQAVVWLKRVSGSKRAKVILGSEGTPTDRATLTITDLPDEWAPYTVRWVPSANRTDAQLAVTNGSAEALTFRIDDAAVYLVDGFTQVENGSFEVDTTGWSVSAGGFAAAATSITRTAGGFGGSYCGRVVVDAADAASGATFDLGTRVFTSGRTYRLRVGAKTVSGSAAVALQWGSPGAPDSATSNATLTSDFAWYTCDWTPSADRTDVELCIRSTTAAARTFDIDEVEVYEASDDLGTDAGDLTWSRSFDAIGTASVEVLNTSSRYDPRYSSSPLYGSVSPGKRLWIRSVSSATLHGDFYGTIVTVEPRPWDGKVDLVCEDMMGFLRDADVFADFAQDDSYQTMRRYVIDSAISGVTAVTSSPRTEAHTTLAGGIEDDTFYRGTDGDTPALDLLADLNEATQTVHFIRPSVHAMIGWKYETVDRATLTDTSSDFTVDESDPASDVTGVRFTHDLLMNRSEVPWQGYERLPPPGADETGFGAVLYGYDPATYGDLGLGDDAPYISYTDDAYGTDDDHPEPRWRYGGIGQRKWRKRKKRGLKVPRRTKVYIDPVLPFAMAAGDVRRFTFDFSIPVSGPLFDWSSTLDPTNFIADYVETRPNRLIIDLRCIVSDTVDYLAIYGTPWQPLDDLTETVQAYDSQAAYGIQSDTSIATPYVGSAGQAQGVASYRTWRWNAPKVAPTLTDRNIFPRTQTAELADHLTVTADRWRFSSTLFVATGLRCSVTRGGLDWVRDLELEDLPTHTDWFILDSSDLDGSDVLAY